MAVLFLAYGRDCIGGVAVREDKIGGLGTLVVVVIDDDDDDADADDDGDGTGQVSLLSMV